MREKEILCRILTFYQSRIRNTVNTVFVQGEEAKGGDAGEGDPVPDPDFLPIPDPEFTGFGSATLMV